MVSGTYDWTAHHARLANGLPTACAVRIKWRDTWAVRVKEHARVSISVGKGLVILDLRLSISDSTFRSSALTQQLFQSSICNVQSAI